MPYVVVAVSGAVVAAVGLVLRKPLARKFEVPARLGFAFGGLALGLALGSGLLHALGYHWERQPADPNASPMLIPATENSGIATGRALPELVADGWLNGLPPVFSGHAGSVMVLDVWADWCPKCRWNAPRLVQTFHKFKDRGVVFLGLTSAGKDSAESFISEFAIPWPNGYGAAETTESLVQDWPTIVVVGADGRIVWNDGSARFHHMDRGLQDGLEAAIERALDEA